LLIYVYLCDLDVGALGSDLIEDGSYHAAGSAPGCPKVKQNGLVGVENFRVEIFVVDMNNSHVKSLLKNLVCYGFIIP